MELNRIKICEVDRSIVFSKPSWSPGLLTQTESRIVRQKPKSKPKIQRIGRYYTVTDMHHPVPHNLKFKSRRQAKLFFAKPLVIRSTQQFKSVFGKPDVSNTNHVKG